MADSDLIWYAAYGTNTLEHRFLCYLQGGSPMEGVMELPGCADTTPPRDERAIILPHQLYFAGRARQWGDGSVAFIDGARDDQAVTYGRAWLISCAQAVEVVRQENGRPELAVDVAALLERRDVTLAAKAKYGRLIRLDDLAGAPMMTQCSPRPFAPQVCKPPSRPYLGTLIAGLRETYNLGRQAVRKYLKDVPGIHGHISGGEIERIYQETGID